MWTPKKGHSIKYKESRFEEATFKYQKVIDIPMSAKKQELYDEVRNISIMEENETLITSGRLNQALCFIKVCKWQNAIDNCTYFGSGWQQNEYQGFVPEVRGKNGTQRFEGAASDFEATFKIESENKAAKK